MNRFVETGLYFIVGAASGYGVVYFVTKKRLEAKLAAEIQDVKNYYASSERSIFISESEEDDFKTLEQVAEERRTWAQDAVKNIMEDEGYTPSSNPADAMLDNPEYWIYDPEAEEEETDAPENKNIFDSPDEVPEGVEPLTNEQLAEQNLPPLKFANEEPDSFMRFQELMDRRTNNSDDPYIISQSESMENGVETLSFVYYEEDEVMVNDEGSVMTNYIPVVGPDALNNFGVGSNDKNIVYVYNPRLEANYEVILESKKSYTEAVLGHKIEKSKPSKMREDIE